MLVSVVGVLALTRMIGPARYGLFAAALGIYLYIVNLSQWGVAVFLIRGDEQVDKPEVYDQAFTLLLALGVCSATFVVCAAPLIEIFVHLAGLRPLLTTLLVILPLQLTNQVPLARLERRLDYRRVAVTELTGQITYYAVALPIAFHTPSAWAPVVGWLAQQCVVGLQLHAQSGLRLRLRWDSRIVRQMLNYGLGYSSSMWVWQLRSLVNPLIVGRFVGPAGVGYVALASRLAEYLCFVKTATYRLSIAALGRVQTEIVKLRRAVTEGMTLQQLVLGPLLVGFSLVGPPLVAKFFGARWTPTMQVFPYVALGILTNALFSLHSSVLYVRRRNWDVTSFHVVHVLMFAGAAWLLVPRFGIRGYGFAELCAIPAYAIVHVWATRQVGSPRYTNAIIWYVCTVVSMLGIPRSPFFALISLFPLVIGSIRAELAAFVQAVRHKLPVAPAAGELT